MALRWTTLFLLALALLKPWCGGGVCSEWSHQDFHAAQQQCHDHGDDGDEPDHDDRDSHRSSQLAAAGHSSLSLNAGPHVADLAKTSRFTVTDSVGPRAYPVASGSDFRAPPPTRALLCVFLT